jgi:DNA-binding response OmpR family regulator
MKKPAPRVLVVEPDERLGDLLEGLLDLWGYDAEIVRDGRQAVAAFARWPAIVLLELVLPDLDGFEVVRHVRSTAQGRDVAIYALTVLTRQRDRDQAHEAGCDLFLAKPINPGDLRAYLRTAAPAVPRARRKRTGEET